MENLSIKNWAADDRPREKLIRKGIKSLSDAELLAILLGTGTRDMSAVELGRKVLAASGNSLSGLAGKQIADLTRLKGIGEAKAVNILAAIELGRRLRRTGISEKQQLSSSREAYTFLCPEFAGLKHEEFWVIFLNRANRIIEKYKCSQGGIAGTVIDIRIILKRALDVLASSFIIAHNHPSGNRMPSENDKQITEKLGKAGLQMDIKLLDHLIVTEDSYFSFADEGLL
jgi:DNA repair protein RadC